MKLCNYPIGLVLLIAAAAMPAGAQQKKPSVPMAQATSKAAVKKPADPAGEKGAFEAAIAAPAPLEKAELLIKFLADYPKSEYRARVQESLAVSRAAIADERLAAGDAVGAVKLFRLAIEQAPRPYPDRMFREVLATIPANLYWRGQQASALEISRLIESNASNAGQLLYLANFYLSLENGDEVKRVAEAAIKMEPTNSAGFQMLATGHRVNFDLEGAAMALAKALELDANSITAKRSLADMKRALGKADEAEALYREVLTRDESDAHARTGLVMALFEGGKKGDAETELAKTLEAVPGNVALLAGAAYWYAANGEGQKAAEFAQRAIDKEPRYVWSHIAMGRALMAQRKPVEAEQTLVGARKYGNFPTLQYEIASARMAAGFFQEAAEELKKSFVLENGTIKTKLGGRVERAADSFTDAIAMERRASTFSHVAADAPENAARLKALLELDQRLGVESPSGEKAAAAAESFSRGDDNMAVHRTLYAANLLLQKNVAIEKAFEMTRSVTAGIDNSLEVANPGAAVMASELYEARTVSFARDDYLLIPEVPKQTLSSLMRGRVEETTGLALLRQGKPEEATIRFRRALTVFPKDSAWWRSATWNLGSSLAAEGKDKEALDAMIASYRTDKPSATRYVAIEALYRKVNGGLEGLDEKVGPSPLPSFTSATPRSEEAKTADTVKTEQRTSPDSGNAEAGRGTNSSPMRRERRLPSTLPVAKPTESSGEQKVAEQTPAVEPKVEETKPPIDAGESKPDAPVASDPKVTGLPVKTDSDSKRVDAAKTEFKVESEVEATLIEQQDPSRKNRSEVKSDPAAEPVSTTPAETKEKPKTQEKTDEPAEPKTDDANKLEESRLKPDNNGAKPIEKEMPDKPVPPISRFEAMSNAEPRPSTVEKKEATGEQETKKPEPDREPLKKEESTEPKKDEPRTRPPDPTQGIVKEGDRLNDPEPRKERAIEQEKTAGAQSRRPAVSSSERGLFDPVVISVGEKEKKDEPKPQPIEEKKPERKAAEVIVSDPLLRPRVVPGQDVSADTETCVIGLSQDAASIASGASIALLVSITYGFDAKEIQGTSSSPRDVEVIAEPEVEEVSGRSLYVIRSVSRRTGTFKVKFAAPCGGREINVRVR